MVEGAVVAALFVILFACMWAAVSYQRAKIRVMEDTRRAIWPEALAACAGSGSSLDDVGNNTSDADSPALPDTKASDQYADLEKSSLAVSSGYVTIEKKRVVTFPGVIGGSSATMRGRMRVRCNEPKPPETAAQFFKQGFSVLKATSGF